MWTGNLFQAVINFQRALCKKDSVQVSMHAFDRFAITYLNISSLLQKFHFPIEVMLHFSQTQKGLELVYRPQFL